jgi:hypothetical protein
MNTRKLIHTALLGITALAGMSTLVLASPAEAQSGPNTGPKREQACEDYNRQLLDAPYVFQYGISPSNLQKKFYGDGNVANDGSYNDAGYNPVHVSGYMDNGQVKYATKWAKVASPSWNSKFGLTGDQFHDRYLALKGTHRLVSASGYNTPAGVRYADIWVKNTTGIGWAVTRDVPAASIDAVKADMKAKGMAPVRIEGYDHPQKGRAFIVVWKAMRCTWEMEEDLTSAQYQAEFNANVGNLRLVHVDSYLNGSKTAYAGIWWKQAGPALRATHGQHWYKFQRSFNNNACDGYVLDNFYAMEGSDGWNTFGGVWTYKGAPSVNAGSSLSARMNYHINCTEGRGGAVLINATTGETVGAHADQVFGSASAIKATVLYALMLKVDDEDLDMDTETIDGVSLTTLATTMMVNSNNANTNILIDYVGMAEVNEAIDDLGLKVTTLNRYMTGHATWWASFKAGKDNFTTPRELATFYRKVWENDGLLSADSYDTFWDIADQVGLNANNLAGGLGTQYYGKAGSKTYNGVPGDFAHRPQLGTHRISSEAGVMEFSNGNLVFYATLLDEREVGTDADAIQCIGWEAAKEWSGQAVADAAVCAYP